jgi:hypothetical protein
LNFKLADLEKINVEQKSKIRKTKRALKIANEELIKTKSEDISDVIFENASLNHTTNDLSIWF